MGLVTEVLKSFSKDGKSLDRADMEKYYRDLIGEAQAKKSCPEELEKSFEAWLGQIDLDGDGQVSQLELACYL